MKGDMQKILDNIIKEIITPLLKNVGFKRLGRNFYKQLDAFGQCFNIQSSLYNSRQNIRFTLNLSLYNERVHLFYDDRPAQKFPKEYDGCCRTRIGHIISAPDYWYELNSKTDFVKLRNTISDHLIKWVIPYFSKIQTIDDILNIVVNTKDNFDQAYLSGILVLNGKREFGIKRLKDLYYQIEAPPYKTHLEKYIRRLNITLD